MAPSKVCPKIDRVAGVVLVSAPYASFQLYRRSFLTICQIKRAILVIASVFARSSPLFQAIAPANRRLPSTDFSSTKNPFQLPGFTACTTITPFPLECTPNSGTRPRFKNSRRFAEMPRSIRYFLARMKLRGGHRQRESLEPVDRRAGLTESLEITRSTGVAHVLPPCVGKFVIVESTRGARFRA